MITVPELLAVARPWIGTPVIPGGAIRGKGCTCMGFAAGVARDCGLDSLWQVFAPYQGIAKPDGPRGLLRVLKRHLITVRAIEPGCLLLIMDFDQSSHVALTSSPRDIIEAIEPRVTERGFAGRNITRVYQVPGVYYG